MKTTEKPGMTLPKVDDITRREFLVGGAATLLLAGCGSGGDSGSGGGTTSAASGTRTIEHKFGSTEVSGSPVRVVSIGYQEHDFLYALGVSPVAVRYWYGDEKDVVRTWAEDEAGDADPEILNMPEGLNFERIAALDPDLIVGLYSGMTRDDYETLSEIAPTIAQSGDYIDYGMPWQETTMMLGRALGRETRAEELVATYSGDTFGVFAAEDPRSRFFTSLGFVVPEEFTELAGDSFYADLSVERLDLLETDVLVWDQLSFTEGGRETIETEPFIRRLDVMQDGRAIFLEGAVEDAFGWNTVLSIPFALKETVPMLERAVGDSTEETTG